MYVYIYIKVYFIKYKIIKSYLRLGSNLFNGIIRHTMYVLISSRVDINCARSSSYFPFCFKDKPCFPTYIPLNSLNFFQVHITREIDFIP